MDQLGGRDRGLVAFVAEFARGNFAEFGQDQVASLDAEAARADEWKTVAWAMRVGLAECQASSRRISRPGTTAAFRKALRESISV